MTPEELYSRLRDIQTPPAPGWWPPAPGWWLSALLVLLILAGVWLYSRHRESRRTLRSAHAELEKIRQSFHKTGNKTELAANLSAWLKRIALFAWPDQPVGGLTGLNWLEFLDRTGGTTAFSHGPGQVFSRAVYTPQPDFDPAVVLDLCRQWLKHAAPVLARQGRRRA